MLYVDDKLVSKEAGVDDDSAIESTVDEGAIDTSDTAPVVLSQDTSVEDIATDDDIATDEDIATDDDVDVLEKTAEINSTLATLVGDVLDAVEDLVDADADSVLVELCLRFAQDLSKSFGAKTEYVPEPLDDDVQGDGNLEDVAITERLDADAISSRGIWTADEVRLFDGIFSKLPRLIKESLREADEWADEGDFREVVSVINTLSGDVGSFYNSLSDVYTNISLASRGRTSGASHKESASAPGADEIDSVNGTARKIIDSLAIGGNSEIDFSKLIRPGMSIKCASLNDAAYLAIILESLSRPFRVLPGFTINVL